jgi:hypothetical protein
VVPPNSVTIGGAGGVPTAGSPGERHLLAAIERAARAPHGWSALVLHLSRLTPPDPRPYHRRIARALMQDAAQRADGQLFALRNADLVLLTRDGDQPGAAVPPNLSNATGERLRRLYGREAGNTAAVVSEWRLPRDTAKLATYAAERLGEPEIATADETPAPPAELVDAVAAAIAGARPQDIIRRQAAVRLDPAGGGAGVTMRPCFRELTFSLDALEARLPASLRIEQDLALMLHLGRYLDQRMLQVLELDQGSASPLDITAQAGGARTGMALHLNLTLPGVLSEGFGLFAARCREIGTGLGVEVSLVEAAADPSAFSRAGGRLRDMGARLVLDGVSHLALVLTRPASLQADLLKLGWSPRMAALPSDEQGVLARAVAAADPARIVLHHAGSEAAVRWGLAHGIRLFQGRHVDQMLAVQRMLACPAANGCTLAQCVARAGATGLTGRAGCTNLPLLDAGMPAVLAAGTKP